MEVTIEPPTKEQEKSPDHDDKMPPTGEEVKKEEKDQEGDKPKEEAEARKILEAEHHEEHGKEGEEKTFEGEDSPRENIAIIK